MQLGCVAQAGMDAAQRAWYQAYLPSPEDLPTRPTPAQLQGNFPGRLAVSQVHSPTQCMCSKSAKCTSLISPRVVCCMAHTLSTAAGCQGQLQSPAHCLQHVYCVSMLLVKADLSHGGIQSGVCALQLASEEWQNRSKAVLMHYGIDWKGCWDLVPYPLAPTTYYVMALESLSLLGQGSYGTVQ